VPTERSWGDAASAYEILGVEVEASPQAIRRAYLDLVRLWHPDRYPDEPARRHEAEAATKRINEAYEVLVRQTSERSRRSRHSPRTGRNNSPRAASSSPPYRAYIHDRSHAARLLVILMIVLVISLMTVAAIISVAFIIDILIDILDPPYGPFPLYR
jgi:preprotein translocase subunit Sec63